MTAPVAVQVTRYACPFCSRSRAKKSATAEHIGRCWSNPATRSCKTCLHFEDGSVEPPALGGVGASCEAGRDLPGYEEMPVVGCPLWESAQAARALNGSTS